MSKYLQDKAEGYVAKWIMETPDAVQELDAYWFYSMTGKAIVWSVIKARKSGPVTLETIKQNCEWSKTRCKPEYFDAVYNQQPIDDASLQYCIRYFKLMGMITNLKESELDGKVKFTKNQYDAVSKIIEHVKAGTDTVKMHEMIHKFWCVKLNKKPMISKTERLDQIEAKRNEIINKFN